MVQFPIPINQRRVPEIPPRDRRIRVIIDSDGKNEVDDQWAISLAILSPERFDIQGFVASNYDNAWGGRESVELSAQEIETVLEKAGMAGRWPVKRGSHPMQYQYEPSESEGVDFIIDAAMASSPDDPLWVIGLGSATNMASAILKKPEIIDRVVAFWHLRTRWPELCYNFNVFGDVRAARLLFHSPLSFVLFDTGTYLTCSMEESEKRVRPYGELGRYLHDYRLTNPRWQDPKKGFFDVGDFSALIDPEIACWEVTDCPEVGYDLRYRFTNKLGSILRCYHVDRKATFNMLYDRLEEHFGQK